MSTEQTEHLPQLSGDIFEAVNREELFEDSKRFVDSVPTDPPEVIRRKFREARERPEFDLRSFVESNFAIPTDTAAQFVVPDDRSMATHIDMLWDRLEREPDETKTHSSLIPLPHSYVIPGGRFRGIYYWDSYFTAEGLAAGGRYGLVESMVRNFASLIERLGFVPNGNRKYYRSRSQFPMFCSMVQLLAREQGIEVALPYLSQVEQEYHFWMDGQDEVAPSNRTHRRTVQVDDALVLNRYWDDNPSPRPEAYSEDRSLGAQVPSGERESLYRNIRAACESGWDFSSRWLGQSNEFASIRTTDIVPIDLNAALFNTERAMATWFEKRENTKKAEEYYTAASKRREAIHAYCWNPDAGFYFDYNWADAEQTRVWSLAAVSPLFFGACSQEQAASVAHNLRERFLMDGGLLTTLHETGEQWDSPNGWAPLQWMAVIGLRQYGYDELAREIADRWLTVNRDVFGRTGKMMEKYNVVDTTLKAGGGEYPVQDGFGWTNGVAQALQSVFETAEDTEYTAPVSRRE